MGICRCMCWDCNYDDDGSRHRAELERAAQTAGCGAGVNKELVEAVRQSLRDGLPVRSCNGVVLMKFTRNARGESVSGVLETAEELEDCRRIVRDNGFEVMPEGRMGPKFFVRGGILQG